jgi:hypothetical protein
VSREAELEAILRASAPMMAVLSRLAALDLPDWMVFSGAVYQRVLNHLGGRPLDYGIKDYDVGYHDGSDLSYEAEDAVIRRAAAAFEPPLREMIEVRNQARVHLWFEAKFAEPYEPLACTEAALERFVSPMFAVGVRLDAAGRLSVAAPFGLEDLFARRLRPNPHRRSPNFERIAAAAKARWPEIEVAG